MNKNNLLILLTGLFFTMTACKDNNPVNTNVPSVPVNITVNLALPTYTYMETPGTFLFLDGGYRGVVLVHTIDDVFRAFDRTCTYQPDQPCSKIEIDSSVYQFRCGTTMAAGFQKCCDSRFQTDGYPSNGPAAQPLRSYTVVRNGNIISISN